MGFVKVNVVQNDDVISSITQLRNNKNVAVFSIRKSVAGVAFLRGTDNNEIIVESYDESRAVIRFETDEESYLNTVVEDIGKEFLVTVVNNLLFGTVIYESPYPS